MLDAMKWLVGIDARPGHSGPLEFARWLRQHDAEQVFEGAHMVHISVAQKTLLGMEADGELMTRARAACNKVIAEAKSDDVFSDLHVDVVEDLESGLMSAADKCGAASLVIGRHRRADESGFVRLGATARRILRSLSGTVIVVPPEFEADRAPAKGPVIVALDLNSEASRALLIGAAKLCAELGLECIPCYVNSVVYHTALYMPTGGYDLLRAQVLASGTERLDRFIEKCGVEVGPGRVLCGDVVGSVAGLAEEIGASMICTGARKLSAAAKFWTHSVSTELTATAPCPVMVVPT